jgi:hypothetical protein
MEHKNKKVTDGIPIENQHEQDLVIYKTPDGDISINVIVENDTVWLTQQQMVALFASSKANISEHIKNIYATEELTKNSTVRNFRTIRRVSF